MLVVLVPCSPQNEPAALIVLVESPQRCGLASEKILNVASVLQSIELGCGVLTANNQSRRLVSG